MSAVDTLERAKLALEALHHVAGTLGREGDKDSEDTLNDLAKIMSSALEASEAKIAALTAENATLREKVEQMESAKLPCDVRLPPRTLIRRGVNVRTLFTAIRQREGWGDAETLFADRAALRQEGKP